MLEEGSILKNKNFLILISCVLALLFLQNWYLGQLTAQTKELIQLNSQLLTTYEDLLDQQLKYMDDVHYMRVTAENLEKQNQELMAKTEKLNDIFFEQIY